jgi:hypothetical protein
VSTPPSPASPLALLTTRLRNFTTKHHVQSGLPILKHDLFDVLLGKHTSLASPTRHLPLERKEFLLRSFRLVRFNYATEQIALCRSLTLGETLVLLGERRSMPKKRSYASCGTILK